MFFTGYKGASAKEFIQQPKGSELCFPALVASYANLPLSDARQLLEAAFVSDDDGSTEPMFDSQLIPLNGTRMLEVEAIRGQINFDKSFEDVLTEMIATLNDGRPVAVLFQKTAEDGSTYAHWRLVMGHYEADLQTPGAAAVTEGHLPDPTAGGRDPFGGVLIHDPQHHSYDFMRPNDFCQMLSDAYDDETTGLFAYSLRITE